jgi:hypothetical protein
LSLLKADFYSESHPECLKHLPESGNFSDWFDQYFSGQKTLKKNSWFEKYAEESASSSVFSVFMTRNPYKFGNIDSEINKYLGTVFSSENYPKSKLQKAF